MDIDAKQIRVSRNLSRDIGASKDAVARQQLTLWSQVANRRCEQPDVQCPPLSVAFADERRTPPNAARNACTGVSES